MPLNHRNSWNLRSGGINSKKKLSKNLRMKVND